MLNRFRATMAVYGRHIELCCIITALILIGGVTGYTLARVEMASIVSGMQQSHLAEINRLQSSNQIALDALIGRVGGIVERQEQTVSKIEDAADTAKQAATTAKSAAATVEGRK